MTVKTIPEREIYICDICGEKSSGKPPHDPVLIYHQSKLDSNGLPIADDTKTYDLCYGCDDYFVEILREFIEGKGYKLKNKINPKTESKELH